jgi:hypothetical protein
LRKRIKSQLDRIKIWREKREETPSSRQELTSKTLEVSLMMTLVLKIPLESKEEKTWKRKETNILPHTDVYVATAGGRIDWRSKSSET